MAESGVQALAQLGVDVAVLLQLFQRGHLGIARTILAAAVFLVKAEILALGVMALFTVLLRPVLLNTSSGVRGSGGGLLGRFQHLLRRRKLRFGGGELFSNRRSSFGRH